MIAMISPQAFVEKVWSEPLDRVIELSDELQSALEDEGNSELVAIELAAKLLPRIKTILAKRIQNLERKNVTPDFRFSDTSRDRLVGILVSEKNEKIRLKLRYKKELQNHIDKIEWKKFENLCLVTLKLSGFTKCGIGRRTKDGGLDFFGFWPMDNEIGYSGVLTGKTLRVFGQAKHRKKSPVTGDEVRSFYTKYAQFTHCTGAAYKYVSAKYKWFLDSQGPIIPMVVTNTSFEDDAEEFAEYERITLREGVHIIEDIVRLTRVEDWLEPTKEDFIFSPSRFDKYLNELGSNAF